VLKVEKLNKNGKTAKQQLDWLNTHKEKVELPISQIIVLLNTESKN